MEGDGALLRRLSWLTSKTKHRRERSPHAGFGDERPAQVAWDNVVAPDQQRRPVLCKKVIESQNGLGQAPRRLRAEQRT